MRARDIMTSPVVTVTPDQHMSGIVTEADLLRGSTPTSPRRWVRPSST